jgi:ribA/ribD-fused uncharacterized protein
MASFFATTVAAQNDLPYIAFFYDTFSPYKALSLFSPHPIKDDVSGFTFPTAAHFYQYQKFRHEDVQFGPQYRVWVWARDFSNPELTPLQAKQLAVDRRWDINPRWKITGEDRAMQYVLRLKMQQHPEVAQLLLSTKDKYLVEHVPLNHQSNKYWNDGGDGSGSNMLGHYLMQLREQIAKQQAVIDPTIMGEVSVPDALKQQWKQ